MSRKTFDVADEIELFGEFYDPDTQAPLDLDTVTLTVEKPGGTTVTPSVTRLSVGRYTGTVTPAAGEHGKWWYRWHGTGEHQAAQERFFIVRKQQVP